MVSKDAVVVLLHREYWLCIWQEGSTYMQLIMLRLFELSFKYKSFVIAARCNANKVHYISF